MYGHCLVLLSPDQKERQALLIIDQQQFHSAVTALKSRRHLWNRYHNWSLMSYTTAYTANPKVRPTVVAAQLAEPGALIDVKV